MSPRLLPDARGLWTPRPTDALRRRRPGGSGGIQVGPFRCLDSIPLCPPGSRAPPTLHTSAGGTGAQGGADQQAGDHAAGTDPQQHDPDRRTESPRTNDLDLWRDRLYPLAGGVSLS